jgi:hypothetical protein
MMWRRRDFFGDTACTDAAGNRPLAEDEVIANSSELICRVALDFFVGFVCEFPGRIIFVTQCNGNGDLLAPHALAAISSSLTPAQQRWPM